MSSHPPQATLDGARQAQLHEEWPSGGSEPEKLEPLVDGKECVVCGESFPTASRAGTHLLEAHAEAVNQRHRETDLRRREGSGTAPGVAEVDATAGNGDGPIRINPDGPASFYEVDRTDHDGQRLDAPAPRECAECGEWVSASYARVWDTPDRELKCRSCAPRSQRFSADPVARSGMDVGHLLGSNNPRSSTPASPADD